MQASEEDVCAFLGKFPCPTGYKYTLVLISLVKRMLTEEMPASYRFNFLERLDRMPAGTTWLTADMIAAIEPVCDKGHEIIHEAQKLGAKKALDVYAQHFATFAELNRSLIAALKLSPAYSPRTA